MMSDELYRYREHINERMLETQGNVLIARSGKFKKLGCIDSNVQKEHKTDLIVAGSLAYFDAGGRGGAYYFLQELADHGKTHNQFELHYPCGELLLEQHITTWAGQEQATSALIALVAQFNTENRTNFGAVVHAGIGTAGRFLE